MNIFYLHHDPRICAEFALDKHCVKMILESSQILYTVYHVVNPELLLFSDYTPYKLTHKNHPCCKWTRENYSNFLWLLTLAWEYCKEYTYRYNKIHACEKHITWMVTNLPMDLTNGPMTQPPQAMPDKYKHHDSIQAYRNYYIGEKLRFARYTKREFPEWLKKFI